MYATVPMIASATVAITQGRCVWSIRILPRQVLRDSVASGVPTQRKNSFGSTRCAASCGQAYTQLGSARSVHKSQEVAFCFTTAISRPAFIGSFSSTVNGCILMLPYGQFFAHKPHPMHQFSMI